MMERRFRGDIFSESTPDKRCHLEKGGMSGKG